MKAHRRDWATLKKEKEWDELIRKHTQAATAAEKWKQACKSRDGRTKEMKQKKSAKKDARKKLC